MSFVIGLISGAIIFAAGIEYGISRFTTEEVIVQNENHPES